MARVSMRPLAFGNRDSIPASGPAYLAIVAFMATTLTVPFVIDRLAA